MPQDNNKSITLPIIKMGDRWELMNEKAMPIIDGAKGTLTIDISMIKDHKVREKLTNKSIHKAFEVGDELQVALTIKDKGQIEKTALQELIPVSDILRRRIRLHATQLGSSPT